MSGTILHKAGRTRKVWLPIAVLLFYGFLSIFLTWPLISQLGSHIPGRIGDGYVHLWTFSWIKDALLALQSPYQTDLLFFPVGANLLNHNIAWVHIGAWLPLQFLLGAESSYSLVHLLAFPLNGFAVFLLAREEIKVDAAAFIAGLVAGFWPYNLSHFDHPNLILICWLPLAILFLGRTLREQRWRDALLSAVFIALLGITRWQLLIMGGFMIAAYVGYVLLTDAAARSKRSLLLLLFTGAAALLLMLPFLYPVLEYQVNRENISELNISQEVPYATDLLAYVVPNRYHPLWGPNVAYATRLFTGNNNYTRAVGYTVLFLVILGIIKRFRKSLFWIITAVIYLLLSLGPDLFVFGKAIFPLPYRLIEDLTIMQLVRFPDRYNVMLSIPVAMLAGYGVSVLVSGISRNRVLLRTAVICGLILFEYMMTFNMLSLHTPTWYESIAEEPGQFGILDVPMHVQTFDTQYVFYQLTHGKPLVEGHVSRPSAEMFSFIDTVPFLGAIYYKERPPESAIDVSSQMRLLQAADVRYLVLHKYLIGNDDVNAWRDWMVMPPIYEDDDIVVFETQIKKVGDELPWKWEVYKDTSGGQTLGLVDAAVPEGELTPGYWIEAQAVWASDAPMAENLDACLHLLAPDGEPIRSECAPLAMDYPTSSWPANNLVHAKHLLEIPPFQEAGTYEVGLSLLRDDAPVGEVAEIGAVSIGALPRLFELPQVAQETAANWEDEIALRGYDADLTADAIELTLYWQALMRMDQSYKFFVHVIDPSTGQVVAQVDTVPHDWSYPTNWWEQGEIVADTLSLSLEGAPAGEYELAVGIYDPATNERLAVTAQDGVDGDADVFYLDSITR